MAAIHQDRPNRRLAPWMALALLALVIAGGITFFMMASRPMTSTALVGRWSYEMFTGEPVESELNNDGTYSIRYLNSGAVSPTPTSKTRKMWKSDGRTITFYEREEGIIGSGKYLLGLRDVGSDAWEIRRLSETEVVLGKPGASDVLVMKRINSSQTSPLGSDAIVTEQRETHRPEGDGL